ncbi:hypothetical protein D3C78_1029910 [compost metagenome]
MIRFAARLSVAVGVVAVVEALRGPDPQRMPALSRLPGLGDRVLAGREHWPEHFFPGCPRAVRPFVHQDEEQAGAPQVVVIVQADHTHDVAGLEGNRALGLVRPGCAPGLWDGLLQPAPEDPLGLLERRRAIPDLVLDAHAPLRSQPGSAAHLCLAEEGLAESTPAHRITEARLRLEAPNVDVRLLRRQLHRRVIGTG